MNQNEKTDMAIMKTEIKYIKSDITEIKELLKEHISEERNAYAGKWVENAIYGFVGLVITTVVVAIIGGVI